MISSIARRGRQSTSGLTPDVAVGEARCRTAHASSVLTIMRSGSGACPPSWRGPGGAMEARPGVPPVGWVGGSACGCGVAIRASPG